MDKSEKQRKQDKSRILEDIKRVETALNCLKEELQQLKARTRELDNNAEQEAPNSIVEEVSNKRKNNSYVVVEYESTENSIPRKKQKLVNIEDENGYEIEKTEEIKSKQKKYKVIEENESVKEKDSLCENDFINKPKKKKRKNKDKTENISNETKANYSVGEIVFSNGEEKLKMMAMTIAETKEKIKNGVDPDFKVQVESFLNLISAKSDANKDQNPGSSFQNGLPNSQNFYSDNYHVQNINISNQWRKEKVRLRDKIKSGFLRLDFQGSNIASILGYGIGINNF